MKRIKSLILITALFAIIYSCAKKDPLVSNDDLITIPNSFSPDGDGIDDIWYIKDSMNLIDGSHFLVRIFNDTSFKVFESTKKTFFWDGSYNGLPCKIGYYSYYISYQTWNSLEHSRTGSIWLYRKP